MAGTGVSGVRGNRGYATTNLWEDRMNTRRLLSSPDVMRIQEKHIRALTIALLRQIAKGNLVPARLVNEVNNYYGYEVVPTEYIEEETSVPRQRDTRKSAEQGTTPAGQGAAPAPAEQGTTPAGQSAAPAPAERTSIQSEQTSISKMRALFTAVDKKDKNGNIDLEEFTLYYIQQKEREGKRFTNPNDPELAKLRGEAKNIFDALSEDGEIAKTKLKEGVIVGSDGKYYKKGWFGGMVEVDPKDAVIIQKENEKVITRKRFQKIVSYYDSASDGKRDGKIDLKYLREDLERFAKEGKDAKISAGKTLNELLA